MSEYDHEPIRGLPGYLPEGETILWQGAPDWRQMVSNALHIRLVAFYFAAIVIWAMLRGDSNTAIAVTLLGLGVLAMFGAFAWGVSRTTIYTLTNKRLVLRLGVALNKCVNLPLSEIETANLKMLGNGHGNIVLSLKGAPRLGYLMLWPHARSLRIVRPQPMLRAVGDALAVSQMLYRATQKVQPVAPVEASADRSFDGPMIGAAA
jgi:Bacterial PH domain